MESSMFVEPKECLELEGSEWAKAAKAHITLA